MTVNEIREVVRAQPFRPFTIYMDDGTSYTIEHPDGVLLGNFVAIVAIPHSGEAISSCDFQFGIFRASMRPSRPTKGGCRHRPRHGGDRFLDWSYVRLESLA